MGTADAADPPAVGSWGHHGLPLHAPSLPQPTVPFPQAAGACTHIAPSAGEALPCTSRDVCPRAQQLFLSRFGTQSGLRSLA